MFNILQRSPHGQCKIKRGSLFIYFLFFLFDLSAQTISQKLQKAFTAFEKDSQMKYGIASFYVVDAQSGQVLFDKNSRIGLTPASTQKLLPV